MDQKRMFQIIDFNPEAGEVTEEELVEAYTKFFSLLDVTVKNPDGTYKSIYEIFKEASINLNRREQLNLCGKFEKLNKM